MTDTRHPWPFPSGPKVGGTGEGPLNTDSIQRLAEPCKCGAGTVGDCLTNNCLTVQRNAREARLRALLERARPVVEYASDHAWRPVDTQATILLADIDKELGR